MKSCLEGSSTICLKSLRKGKLTLNIINLYLTNYERIISPSSDSIDDHALSTTSEWMLHTLNTNDLYSLDGPMLAVSVAEDEEIVDVDTFKYEDTIEKPKPSAPACKRFLLTFPETKSPNTAYPFALHDTLILPWDYALKNGVCYDFRSHCRPTALCQRLLNAWDIIFVSTLV